MRVSATVIAMATVSLMVAVAQVAAAGHHGRAIDGFLIDAKSAELARFQANPELYTVGDARSALAEKTPFTVLVPEHSSSKVTELDAESASRYGDDEWARHMKSADPVNNFGWKNGMNPKQIREEKKEALPAAVRHTRCTHPAAKHGNVVSTGAVEKYLEFREDLKSGHLKVRVIDERKEETLRQFSTQGNDHAMQLFQGTSMQSGAFTVEALLADQLCLNLVIAIDGANMLATPSDHSKGCATLPQCTASGYTLLTIPPTTTETSYGQLYNFTTEGNAAALEFLNTLPNSQTNLVVTITGRWTANGTFEIVGQSTNTFGDSMSESSASSVAVVASGASSPAMLATTIFIVLFSLVLNL